MKLKIATDKPNSQVTADDGDDNNFDLKVKVRVGSQGVIEGKWNPTIDVDKDDDDDVGDDDGGSCQEGRQKKEVYFRRRPAVGWKLWRNMVARVNWVEDFNILPLRRLYDSKRIIII